jgi:AAT family amino acid transporter
MFINPDTRISVIAGALVLIVATIVYLVRHKSEFKKNN